LGGEQYRTENFFPTLWGISRPLLVGGRQVGSLEIHALTEKLPLYEGPLLREEVVLLDRAAEYLAWAVRNEESKRRFSREMEYLRAALNVSKVPQLVVDRNGTAIYLNNAFEAATGLSLEELRFRNIWNVVRVRDAPGLSCTPEEVRKSFRNVCETGVAEEVPDAFSLFPCRGDGKCRMLRMAPLWGMEQEILGVLFALVFPGVNDEERFPGGEGSDPHE
jgi:PAS domain S-box-containing protein